MKAKWLISNLGKDEQIQSLLYGVLESGREAKLITLGETAELIETVSDEEDCVITYGSIWTNKALKEARPNWVGNFHSQNTFRCSTYYEYWKKYLTQKNFVFLTLDVIFQNPFYLFDLLAIEDQVFIRPDSGEKEFNGELVHRDRFKAWQEDTETKLSYANLKASDILCVVSQPIKIEKEYRLVIADNKVVTGSVYRAFRHLHSEEISKDEMPEIETFVEKVLNSGSTSLPPFFVLDIAKESDGKLSIMEVGCFCCCGLYAVDRRKVAEAISVSAEKAFEERCMNETV